MIKVTLPDGSQKEFPKAVSVQEVAESIGTGLAKAALAGKINGVLVDTSYLIDKDVNVAIITDKNKEGLDILRHSTAHLLANAVKDLFPEAQYTIGPVIEDGFYYDFAYARSFTPEDLIKIEARMHELAEKDIPVSRYEISREEAIKLFKEMGEEYKVKIINDIPAGESLTFYKQGNFIDLCRGPHAPSTGKLKVFKLMKLAGAYWRGDQKNEMLQRIYGTAWANKKELVDYLFRLEEAEKRDHRKIAKKLDLFHLQEEAPGMIFWHQKGWQIYRVIQEYIREKLAFYHYQEVRTPIIVNRVLWEKSGHWDKFGKEMFTTNSENSDFAIKPMNCPCHIQIFNQGLHSYRDLPLRLAEFGSLHRNEPSGALHGMMRAREFVQDDAHIFCTEAQVQDEVMHMIQFVYDAYKDFGFEQVIVKLSTRPDARIGSDEVWDKAEAALAASLERQNIAYDINPGEGAFYGPKIEFTLKDCLGRHWQCGTIQVDFSMPERLEAQYVAEDGTRKTPIMIHRAILGSIERFIGILIEHYAGFFPLWLAPIQVIVLNITDKQAEYAGKVHEFLQNRGVRTNLDLRNEKIGYKIREHTLQHIPYLVIIGDKEVEAQVVTVRKQNGEDLGQLSLSAFCERIETETKRLGKANKMGD